MANIELISVSSLADNVVGSPPTGGSSPSSAVPGATPSFSELLRTSAPVMADADVANNVPISPGVPGPAQLTSTGIPEILPAVAAPRADQASSKTIPETLMPGMSSAKSLQPALDMPVVPNDAPASIPHPSALVREPQELPLPLMTEVAAAVYRALTDPEVTGSKFDFSTLSELESAELPAQSETSEEGNVLPGLLLSPIAVVHRHMAAAGESALMSERNLPRNGKGLPSPVLLALSGSEASQLGTPSVIAGTAASAAQPPTAAPTELTSPQLQALSDASFEIDSQEEKFMTEGVLEGGMANTADDQAVLEVSAATIKANNDPGVLRELSLSNSALRTPPRVDSTPAPMASVVPELTLQMHQKDWNQALGQQLIVMARNHIQEAEIKVNPAHLGPLEVRLSVHQDQATVTFYSHDAMVRDNLESALPRLREMLSNHGVQLGDASVSDQAPNRQQHESRGQSFTSKGLLGEDPLANEAGLEQERSSSLSLQGRRAGVDHYV